MWYSRQVIVLQYFLYVRTYGRSYQSPLSYGTTVGGVLVLLLVPLAWLLFVNSSWLVLPPPGVNFAMFGVLSVRSVSYCRAVCVLYVYTYRKSIRRTRTYVKLRILTDCLLYHSLAYRIRIHTAARSFRRTALWPACGVGWTTCKHAAWEPVAPFPPGVAHSDLAERQTDYVLTTVLVVVTTRMYLCTYLYG